MEKVEAKIKSTGGLGSKLWDGQGDKYCKELSLKVQIKGGVRRGARRPNSVTLSLRGEGKRDEEQSEGVCFT